MTRCTASVASTPGRAAQPSRRPHRPPPARPQSTRSLAACSATPGTTCAASRCSGSRASIIVLFLLMAAFPCAVHLRRPGRRRSVPQPGPAVGRCAGSATTCRAATSTPGDLRRAGLDRGAVLAVAGHRADRRHVGIIAGYRGGWVDAAAVPDRRRLLRSAVRARRDRHPDHVQRRRRQPQQGRRSWAW